MEEWREMSKEAKWETLGDVEMTYYGEEETSGGSGETAGKAPVSSKAPPPPPKAPTTHWQDLKVEKATATGKGKDSQ